MRRYDHRWGFTLIELLVVIAIIALLLSIIIPALRKAKTAAQKVICANQQKQIGLSLTMYAGENEDFYPLNTRCWFLWDISYMTTDYIIATGGDKRTFYCPLGQGDPDLSYFWQHQQVWAEGVRWDFAANSTPEPRTGRENYYRCTDYFWLMDTQTMRGYPPQNSVGGSVWPRKMSKVRNASSQELVTDAILSDEKDRQTADFGAVLSGGSKNIRGVGDQSSHLNTAKNRSQDSNILFVDGHIQRRGFGELNWHYRAGPYHWW